ncbi:MAG: hypothetical protein WBA12_03355, partial [Catalinimonas sp.]
LVEWFSRRPGRRVRTAASVLTRRGESRRVDRLLLEGDTATVVDFEVGGRHPEYHERGKKYLGSLQRLGYRHVTGWVVFVGSGEVERVF